MDKLQYIKAFTEWNNKQIYSIGFMAKALFLNAFFSAGLYLLALIAKINAELSILKWACGIVSAFLILLLLYVLPNFKRENASKCLFYAITFINLSLSLGASGLFTAFFTEHHSLNNCIFILYIIGFFVMLFFGFVYNHIMIINGKYVTAKSPHKYVFYSIFGALGMIVSGIIGKTISESTNTEIMVFLSALGSYLMLIVAANCFLRWYYILRYKV